MSLTPTSEDGGDPISGYKIFRDDGSGLVGSSYTTEVTTYDGSASTHTVTVAADGLVLGKLYRFVYVATNSFGDSAFSQHLIAGVGAPPQVTVAPVRDTAYDAYNTTTETVQMMITWDRSSVTTDLPVLGF